MIIFAYSISFDAAGVSCVSEGKATPRLMVCGGSSGRTFNLFTCPFVLSSWVMMSPSPCSAMLKAEEDSNVVN